MGFFDKLMEKKYCSICNAEVGKIFNKKLEDGYLCKECAGKLSPFFDERRHSTVEEIKEQLAYREENQANLEHFQVTKTLGKNTKVRIDEDQQKFVVSPKSKNWAAKNPDIIDFTQVTGCTVDVEEYQNEVFRTNKKGETVSYNPPRYTYEYDVSCLLEVNHPYFSQIKIAINDSRIEDRKSLEFENCNKIANEIKRVITNTKREIRKQEEAAAAPKQAVVCPSCGATTTPDENGCCEYCGMAL